MEQWDSFQAWHGNQMMGGSVGTQAALPALPTPPPGLVCPRYLKSFHLHLLELCLILQVTDDGLLPADDGAVHRGLLQVLDAKLSHLQLEHIKGVYWHR